MKQHYIPKLILERFVDDSGQGNRGVWVYKMSEKKWRKRPLKRIASIDDFYSLVEASGERDDALENYLHQIETPMALLLDKDIATKRKIAPPRPHDLFVTFCSHLMARNPSTIGRVKDLMARDARALIIEMTESPEAFQRARAELKDAAGIDIPNIIEFERIRTDFAISATKVGGLVVSFAMAEVIAERLGRMAVDLFVAQPNAGTFITTDVPYGFIRSETDSNEYDQVIVPLTATIAAVFNQSEKPAYRYISPSSREVGAVNRAMLTVAQEYVISRTPEVIDLEYLNAWADADAEERLELIKTWDA